MAKAYATGVPGQKVPVVDDRFKGGGNKRFEKLSPEYLMRKGAILKEKNKGLFHIGKGKHVSLDTVGIKKIKNLSRAMAKNRRGIKNKLISQGEDENEIKAVIGELAKADRAKLQKEAAVIGSSAIKSPSSLPILVLSGTLKNAVTSRRHTISQSGDIATVTFHNLPDYAIYHHEGVPQKNLPMRSPVQPNEADIERIEAYAKRRLAAIYGKTTSGQQSQGSGKASGI